MISLTPAEHQQEPREASKCHFSVTALNLGAEIFVGTYAEVCESAQEYLSNSLHPTHFLDFCFHRLWDRWCIAVPLQLLQHYTWRTTTPLRMPPDLSRDVSFSGSGIMWCCGA